MKMKNTMISNQCNKIDPLSTAVSTESSITSGKKKKKGFFSKVKAIFSKSSTEAQKNFSGPLHNALKNTYVVRENHGACSNDLQIYGQLNDETNPEKAKIYCGIDVNHKENKTINSALVSDDNFVNLANENINSACPSAKNNGSWITTSTNTSQRDETNFRNIFTDQTALLSGPVDVGIQTKIPSCYKVYLLHKHVSNCDRRNKSNSKIKKKIFLNRNKKSSGTKSYYYYKYSSIPSIYSDESHSDDKWKGKPDKEHRRKNKTKNNKQLFNKSMRYNETNDIDIEFLDATGKPSKNCKIFNSDSNLDIIIDNDDITSFSGTPISNSPNSSSFDSMECQKLKYRKTKGNYQTTERKTNERMQEEANAEGSQSKSLPSLHLFEKNRSIRNIKCNSSPVVSQNMIQTRNVKEKESITKYFTKNSKNNKVLKSLKNFHTKNSKNNKEAKHKKSQPIKKYLRKSSEEVSNYDNEKSDSAREIKKEKISNLIKIRAKGNHILKKTKLNKLENKLENSNSSIKTGIWQTNRSAIINDDLNTIRIYKNKNDHLIYANSDDLKLNRRPIITQPMIFFNENIKSDTENEVCNYFFNKIFTEKGKKVRDINMKLIEKQLLIKNHSNLKLQLEHQYPNPYKVNYNHPITSDTKKHINNAANQENKKKLKNHEKKGVNNSTSPPLRMNKQKLANFITKNIKNQLNLETNSYLSINENYNKRSNVICSKKRGPNCIPQFRSNGKTFKRSPKNNYSYWKPSSEILKSSNLTEISFECNLQKYHFDKNKQVNKKTQKNWNENYSHNHKLNMEKKFNKDPKNLNQEIRMFHDIEAEKLLLKKLSSNVGVHGAFAGNITSKRKTFFTKINNKYY